MKNILLRLYDGEICPAGYLNPSPVMMFFIRFHPWVPLKALFPWRALTGIHPSPANAGRLCYLQILFSVLAPCSAHTPSRDISPLSSGCNAAGNIRSFCRFLPLDLYRLPVYMAWLIPPLIYAYIEILHHSVLYLGDWTPCGVQSVSYTHLTLPTN